MNDQRSIELIHAELDGEISAAEKDELDARLQEDPGLTDLREQLRGLASALERIEPVEPPPGLRARILAAVRPVPRRSIIASLLPGWQAPTMLRYGMAAAFGAAVAAVALQLGTMESAGPADVRGLVGTIASYQTPSAPEGAISLNSQGITGSIETHSQNGMVVLDFDLAAERPVGIVADYSRSGLSFGGFAQLENAAASLDAQQGRITFLQQQSHRYAVFFDAARQAGGTIELRFLVDGELVRTETVDLNETAR